MKNLGCMNGWYGRVTYPNGWDGKKVKEPDNIPLEYTKCVDANHPLVEVNKGRCWTQYTCPICNITWDVDSSD